MAKGKGSILAPAGNTADEPSWITPGEILESIGEAFYALDRQWRFVYVNGMAERLWGKRRQDLLGKAVPAAFPAWVGSESHRGHEQVMESGRPLRLETLSSVTGTPVEINIFPRDDGLSVYFRDIAARKKYEEHVAFTSRELSHRTKNISAVVQAMIRQISQRARSLPEFEERLHGCITALAHCHDLLVASDWQGADLRSLINLQMAPFGLDEERLRIEGPDVSLSPQAAQVIALALHELATNAVKHGALSTPAGTVTVAWQVEAGGGSR